MADTSLRPRLRPGPTKTGRMTVRNRPVWQNPLTKEIYSEKTVTIPWGDGYATVPSVDGQGNELSREELFPRIVSARDQLGKGGPVDFITGEELPVFGTEEDAIKYAMWRSSTMFDKEAAAQGFQLDQYELAPEKEDPSFLYDMGSYAKNIAGALGALGLRKLGFDAYPTENSFAKGGVSMLPAVDDDTRSTEEYLADTKPMDISSVPTFQRPMDASDNDPLVGEDDAGNPVYRTMLGNTYTVRRNPDQRTTRTKIQEDVLPAVRDYLADPTAPTAEQAITAAKAIAGDAWETISIPGDLLSGEKSASDVTLGQVFELTGGTGAASTMFDVPGGRDTLRIFGGANAEGPPNMRDYGGIEVTFENEADFKTQMDLDIDFEDDPSGSMVRIMDEIERNPSAYPKTLQEIRLGKWFRGRDNMMRFEIDDSKSSIKNMDIITDMDEYDMDAYIEGSDFKSSNVFPDSSIQGMPGEKAFTTLEDVLKHDELYRRYPEIRNAPVINDIEYFDQHPNTSGYFDPYNGSIAVNPKKLTSPEELRSTLLHEIQHLIQHLEGFETGTSSYSGEVYQIKTALNDSPTAKKAMKDYERDIKIFDAALPKVYEQVADKNAEVARKLLDIALDKVEKETGISAVDIIEGLSQNKIMSEIIKEKTGKPATRLYWTINSLFNIAEKRSKEFGSAFIATKLGDQIAEDSKYTDYLGYLSDEERLDALESITRKSGFFIQEALKKYDESDGYFASEFLKSFGYPIRELKNQNFFDRDPIKLAGFYGIDVPEKPIKPKKFGSHIIYTSKRGETEARLVSARKDIPGSERSPENVFDQEDIPPESQWGEPELKRVREGKDVLVGYRRRPSASENPTLKDFGYYVDNPSESWVKGKQEYAEKYAKEGGRAAKKLLSGSQTAFLGIDKDKPLYLDVDFVSQLKGANDEVIGPSNTKYIELKESVEKEGFKPDQKGNTILIGVNHKGQAFIMEGNNRVAVAKEYGVPSIKAEVKYFNGGEDAGGEFSPENILSYASTSPVDNQMQDLFAGSK